MPLDHRTLDVHDDSPANRALLKGWLQAAYRGFHQPRAAERTFDLWLEQFRADDVRVRGAWLAEGRYGAGPVPVATYASWPSDLNTGAGLVPVHLVSDVTVSPAHRRQGLLRRLIAADLEEAAAAGFPLAALTVSEGGIYGRFGFGPALWRVDVEVDVGARFRMLDRDDAVPGRMEIVDPRECGELFGDLFARWHARCRGSVRRQSAYRSIVTGEWDWDSQAADERLRAAVHLDRDERPDGYVLWRHQGWERPRTVQAGDIVGETPQVEAELWRFLAGLDLTDKVKAMVSVEDPLPWMLADPQLRSVTGTRDLLWVRVLDAAAALEARPWYADGEVVLDVADAHGHAAGRWRLAVAGGRARVGREEGAARTDDVRLDVAVLGSLYLGGVAVGTLASAGRLGGSAESVEAFGRMADGGPAPFSRTMF